MPSWARTDVGRFRSNNEDAFIADDELGLYAVADGMGGHAAGEVASAEALHALQVQVASLRGELTRFADPDNVVARADLVDALQRAVRAVARAVFRAGDNAHEKGRRRMGTTLCGAVVAGRQAMIVHVGDSRAYLLRGGRLHRLTEDHTVVVQYVKSGIMGAAEAETSPMRNLLSRTVGTQPTVQADLVPLELKAGDRLLFCTDGLHDPLDDTRIAHELHRRPSEDALEHLLVLASQGGGLDNATGVLVDIEPDEQLPPPQVDPDAKVLALEQTGLFAALKYGELVRLLGVTRTEILAGGEQVFAMGEPGDSLLVVVEGCLEVRRGDSLLATVGPGEHVGELALLEDVPRAATVVAREPTSALRITNADFRALVARDAALGVKLLWHVGVQLSRWLRETTDRALAGEEGR